MNEQNHVKNIEHAASLNLLRLSSFWGLWTKTTLMSSDKSTNQIHFKNVIQLLPCCASSMLHIETVCKALCQHSLTWRPHAEQVVSLLVIKCLRERERGGGNPRGREEEGGKVTGGKSRRAEGKEKKTKRRIHKMQRGRINTERSRFDPDTEAELCLYDPWLPQHERAHFD